MRKTLLFLVVFGSLSAQAVEGLYIGARAGTIGFSPGTYDGAADAFALGADLGFWFTRAFEIQAQFQASQHNTSASTLTNMSQFLSLEVHPFYLTELNLSFGAGIGKIWLSDATSKETDTGASFGVLADYIFNKSILLGISTRFFTPFTTNIGGNYWSAMLRVGWLIRFGGGQDRVYIR